MRPAFSPDKVIMACLSHDADSWPVSGLTWWRVMERKSMTVEEARKAPSHQLQGRSILMAVSVGEREGEESQFLYVKSLEAATKAFPASRWHPFLVEMRKLSTPRLVRFN